MPLSRLFISTFAVSCMRRRVDRRGLGDFSDDLLRIRHDHFLSDVAGIEPVVYFCFEIIAWSCGTQHQSAFIFFLGILKLADAAGEFTSTEYEKSGGIRIKCAGMARLSSGQPLDFIYHIKG